MCVQLVLCKHLDSLPSPEQYVEPSARQAAVKATASLLVLPEHDERELVGILRRIATVARQQ